MSPAGEVFAEAQRVVRWHHQRLVLHSSRPRPSAPSRADVLANGRNHFTWRHARYIPGEFSAAYRFGQSQVRPRYCANFGTSIVNPMQLPVLESSDLDELSSVRIRVSCLYEACRATPAAASTCRGSARDRRGVTY